LIGRLRADALDWGLGVHLPLMNDLFHPALVPASVWPWILALAVLTYVVAEADKLLWRRRSNSQDPSTTAPRRVQLAVRDPARPTLAGGSGGGLAALSAFDAST
jgi:hypothetical protein